MSMAPIDSDSEEAITYEEIASTDIPEGSPPQKKPRNAFSEMMAHRSPGLKPAEHESSSEKPHKSSAAAVSYRNPFKNRDGLGVYLERPSEYSSVIFHNENFVAIHDKFPKSSVHTLLLPRSSDHNLQHPFDAFEDRDFLALVQAETARLKVLVAKELQRKYGQFSEQDALREAVLDGKAEAPIGEDGRPRLPPGRDWEKEVIVGIHIKPSMNHLHVHVLSRDMFSEKMKHRKHYNSFNTPFLVDINQFPLPKNDFRRGPGPLMHSDLVCWRCGKNFGNRFSKLKEHLKEEFEEWKKE